MMLAELVGATAPEWTALLRTARHDAYHLPAYVALSAAREDPGDCAEALAVIVRDGTRAMLLPIIMRCIPGQDDARDATSPYGYPGPIFVGAPDREFVVGALRATVALLRERGVISLFVRTHPILNRGLETGDTGMLIDHGDTVSIDLTATVEELWRGTRPSHRNEINQAIHAGSQAYIDEDWQHAETFLELYARTMERLGADRQYLFGADYLRELRAALGARLHLCVVGRDGTITAAGLFTEQCGIVEYHLSGTDERFARERPTKLMLHFVRGLMKERGNRIMHLGGGLGGSNDTLFAFKAGFSRDRQAFRTWRVVIDPDRYARLSYERDPASDPAEVRGFFPSYRQAPR